MRPLRALYASGKPIISFELFPPKNENGMQSLFAHLQELINCKPAYITCTYGAGGSTRERTLEVLAEVRERYPQLPLGSHLTCIGNSPESLRAYIRRAMDIGVDRIVALRGDRPADNSDAAPAPGEFSHAVEMVRLLQVEFPELGVIVAGYPETHPEAPSMATDLDHLKEKVDAGADVVITQLFYENADYFRFRDRCEETGITAPIVPGILPVTNLNQIRRITSLCGTHLSPRLVRRLEVFANDDEGQHAVGVYYAARQAEELITQGAPGIHFYVLNKSRSAAHICRALALFTPVD